MTFEELKKLDSQYVVQSYGRSPIAIDHGQGATLYGVDGKEYIDFTAGIGVLSVGTATPKWNAALSEQAGKQAHIL
ncbi:MAG: aminotransferase class III-fold pyridoxal phosphate-dependent enzyme, partial [Oscillospiraceae bacterium]|nr:aminotransferase class III-fold pyridoxal phosphate-dependent enzyme [Oscillospiraceae bacterium]